MQIVSACAAIALALSAAVAAAAELRGDSILLCDATREPSSSLKPSEVRRQLEPLLREGEFGPAYARLADIAGGVLGKAMGVERFVALLRNAQGRSFDVVPDGNTEKIFRAAPADTITIDCAPVLPQHIVDLSTAALIAEEIRVKRELPAMRLRAEALAKASRDAEDLLKNGLAMWPWELWLNGLRLSKKDADPLFRTQWVFMRPTAGIEIDTYSQASADLQASVMLEPFGFVRYRGDGYAAWWGASVVVTSSSGRGAGIGALFRWDNYVIGLTRHKGEGARRDSNFLLIGVDLYEALNKRRPELKDWEQGARLN